MKRAITYLLLTITFGLLVTAASAQNKTAKVSGKIADTKGQPMEFTNIN